DWRAGTLSRPPGRDEALAYSWRESAILEQISRRWPCSQTGPGGSRPCRACRFACRLSVRRSATAVVGRPSPPGTATHLAAGRANLFARCPVAETAGRADARSPGRWRYDHRCRPRNDWSRTCVRTEIGSGMNTFAALLIRDMQLTIRVGGGALMGALFFLIVITMIPFAVGPDLALLRRIGPAILWLGALLASLLALDRLFATDHEDGSLDLLMMGGMPLELAVATKAIAHWITTGLPLVVIAPLLGLMLNVELHATGWLALTLAAGTPALTFIGLIGAALSV